MLNEEKVSVNVKRLELCDLILACTIVSQGNPNATKWKQLREELKRQLEDFDAKYGEEK